MSNSYANILCTTKSAANAFAGSALPVFDTDLSSVAFSSKVSRDITWDQSAGTITFSKAGVYHVVFTAHTSQATAVGVQTVTFDVGGVVKYTGTSYFNLGYEPKESTFQRILSFAAGDVLTVKMLTSAGTAGLEKGASLIITEITSGDYASATVSTVSGDVGVSELNPFDTDITNAAAIADDHKIANGIAFTADEGKMTVPRDGKYLIMVTNLYNANASSGVNVNIVMYLNKNSATSSGTILTQTVKMRNNDDPSENTFCVIEDLDADDYITATWNAAGATAALVMPGCSLTIYRLGEFDTAHANPKKRGQDKYLSLVNLAAMTATASEVNPWDEDSYSSASWSSRSSSGITHSASAGTFTVDAPGLYVLFFNPILQINSGDTITMKVKVNGATLVTADTVRISSDPDPLDRGLSAFLALKAGDVITITLDAASNNVGFNTGSSITIFRYSPFAKRRGVPTGRIKNDHSLDTFSIENLTAQYEGNADQVPFSLGIRGRISRGRTTAPTVTGGGTTKK